MPGLILIYLVRDVRSDPAPNYWLALTQALVRQAKAQGYRTRILLDQRPAHRPRPLHADVSRIIAEGDLAGIVAPTFDLRIDHSLLHCGVPVAVHGPVTLPGAVDHDQRQLGELAVDLLAAAGCRTLAVVCPHIMPGELIAEDREDTALACGFVKRAEVIGIPLAPFGIRGRDLHYPAENLDQARLSKRLIRNLAAEGHNRLGILVWPDSMAGGAMEAWLALGGRTSGIDLVVHRNRGLGTQCFADVLMVESDHELIASEMLAECARQRAGEPPGRTLVAYHQVEF